MGSTSVFERAHVWNVVMRVLGEGANEARGEHEATQSFFPSEAMVVMKGRWAAVSARKSVIYVEVYVVSNVGGVAEAKMVSW